MTHSVKLLDASFSKYVASLPPYFELAKMFLLLGGDAATSKKNYAGLKADATVIGTPVFGVGYATLNADTNGFEAPMLAGKSPFTHVAIVTKASANIGYCGNWTTGNAANMLNRVNETMAIAVDGNQRANVPMTATGFQFIAGSHDGTTATAHIGSGGTLTSASAAFSGGNTTSSKFRLGANQYSTGGSFNAAAVMTFDSVLTASQLTEVYNYLRTLVAGRGVSVA